MSKEREDVDFYLVGGGRVGRTFARSLAETDRLAGIWTRSAARASELEAELGVGVDHGSIPSVSSGTVCVIAVTDRAVATVLGAHPQREDPGSIFLHVSGSLGCEVFSDANVAGHCGVAHPLHSFPERGASQAELRGAVMAIMGHDEAREAAFALAGLLALDPVEIPEDAAVAYHLAATVASNGVYALLNVASSVLSLVGIEDERVVRGMARLAAQSAESARQSGVVSAATGPVVRGDASTVQNHRRWLSDNRSKASVIYRVLSEWLVAIARQQGVRPSLLAAVESVLADESP